MNFLARDPDGERIATLEESTSRLKAENEELRVKLEASRIIAQANENTMNVWDAEAARQHKRADAAEATMREVAEGLRDYSTLMGDVGYHVFADRLDPPPVVEKPLHAYFPSDVNAGSRSPCVHCGQAYDAHVPPSVVDNPPA